MTDAVIASSVAAAAGIVFDLSDGASIALGAGAAGALNHVVAEPDNIRRLSIDLQ